MKFLEKDLEQIIFENIQTKDGCELLSKKGLDVSEPTKCYKQLRIGNYGVADLITIRKPVLKIYKDCSFHSSFHVCVYEFKKDKISMSAFLQAIRYAKGVKQYLKHRGFDESDILLSVTLIGKEIDRTSDFIYLPEFIKSEYLNLKFYTYDYELGGLYFYEHKNYSLIHEGFKS